MTSYKYYLSVTSQLPFCSVPIRLDTYNKCQFGCSYCFAKARGGNTSTSSSQHLNTKSLQKRLDRVFKGNMRSALDEMLSKRIPIQLGGMTDPFSNWEIKNKITKRTLEILSDFNYPVLISTKGDVALDDDYINILNRGNYYFRISFTGASDELREKIERGVPSLDRRLRLAEKLSHKNIPTAARLQPIIPGYEEDAGNLITAFNNAGIKHVSAEYLKWPVEHSSKQAMELSSILPQGKEKYIALHSKLSGREYNLPSEYKYRGLKFINDVVLKNNMTFGYADNEFLLLNKFKSCCNAADLYLKDANFFDFNILGIIRSNGNSRNLYFQISKNIWAPSFPLNTYINSRSRVVVNSNSSTIENWTELLKRKWNAKKWRGGPESYWGISDSGRIDVNGNKIYLRSTSF